MSAITRNSNLGQHIIETSFDEILGYVSIFASVKVYRQLKENPDILGYIAFKRNEIGQHPAHALMPYGPGGTWTFESVDDARGIALGGEGIPLTDPRYAFAFARNPRYISSHLDHFIKEATRKGYEQLPSVWAKD